MFCSFMFKKKKKLPLNFPTAFYFYVIDWLSALPLNAEIIVSKIQNLYLFAINKLTFIKIQLNSAVLLFWISIFFLCSSVSNECWEVCNWAALYASGISRLHHLNVWNNNSLSIIKLFQRWFDVIIMTIFVGKKL